jgi:DNA polymerase III alpha subunit (gram-positive type)
MTEENAVVQELDKTGPQVDPKETAAAGTEKVGEEADPQGTQEQGEKEQEKKRAGGWQRRQWKAEQERDYWREVALKNAPKQEAVTKVEVKAKPSWAEYEAAGKSEQYFEDLAEYKADQKLQAYKAEQKAEAEKAITKTEQEKQAERWSKAVEEIKAEHSDFDEVIAQGNPSDLLSNLVARSKEPARLAYHLANNPELETRLSRMNDPVEVAQELGEIRAQLAQPSQAAEEVIEPPISKAPKPITPVSKSSPAKSEDIHDPKLPWKRFVALREAELAKRK